MLNLDEYVSCEVFKRYHDLLFKWNKTINLVSPNSLNELMSRHVLDSLQLLKYIPSKNIEIIDLGSGAGLPGIVLSLAGIKKVTLIESDSRKAAFLLQASKLSSGEVNIINDRIENVSNLECDILTSRALASLDSLFLYSQNILVRDKYLLHKGESYQDEIDGSKKHWLFSTNVHDSITSKDSKILEIKGVSPVL
ncbi:16S rRNA (guanine(527)-N(7))-methyltransferase RsmG [Rickettsiaceae bacterium]|nr:16S rRNA (guanine(527)-N(7))-methyltransferase RsmG [Rickettsiaceae bacterium]